MRKKSYIIGAIILVLTIVSGTVLITAKIQTSPEKINFVPSGSTDHYDIYNKETADKIGVEGYIVIKPVEKLSELRVQRDKNYTIELEVTFISYDEKIKETTIILNTKENNGLEIVKALGDGKGFVRLNDLITYNPNGKVVLKAGEPTIITATLNVPKDVPEVKIPFRAVGISAGYEIIDELEVKMDAS